MTLYCDTSSLVKLYVQESGSDDVRSLVAQAASVFVSAVTYVELCATLARARRDRRITPSAFRTARAQFDAEWSALVAIDLTPSIRETASELADRHYLRALDAIQLATFSQVLERSTDDELQFSSFDARLTRAARRLR